MIVSRLTPAGDWTFGKGRANYAQRSEAITQTVSTRIKSMRGDWFLDTSHGSPWRGILGQPGDETRLVAEVRRVVLATQGVRQVTRVTATRAADRSVSVSLTYRDIYNTETTETVTL